MRLLIAMREPLQGKIRTTADNAVAFLEAAVAYYNSLGVTVTRVMTDNGGCYLGFAFLQACRDLGLKLIRTRPYTPKTNGKAERFIQTALREWACAQAYPTSDHRAAQLPVWLHQYNWHRPSWRHEFSIANQQTRSNRGQPPDAPRLAALMQPDPGRVSV